MDPLQDPLAFGRATLDRTAVGCLSRWSRRTVTRVRVSVVWLVLSGSFLCGVLPASAYASRSGGPPAVISMGDSMISGQGGRWNGNSLTDTGSRDGTDRACVPDPSSGGCSSDDASSIYLDGTAEDECLRSDIAEVMSAQIPGVVPVNVACGGAVTADLLPTSDGGQVFKGEPPQGDDLIRLARRYDVKLIAISVGINDLGGGGAVIDCAEDFFVSNRTCAATDQPKLAQEAAKVLLGIERVVADTRTTMRRAGYKPWEYRLVLQSYPDPLAPGSALRYREGDRVEKINDGCPFYGADATWIRDYDFALTADLVRKAAAVTHTEYLDLTRLFDNHEVCSNHNGLVTSTSPPSPRTTEWARFFSIQHTAAQAIPSGPSSVPLMNSKDDGLGEILHPGYFGQLALGGLLARDLCRAGRRPRLHIPFLWSRRRATHDEAVPGRVQRSQGSRAHARCRPACAAPRPLRHRPNRRSTRHRPTARRRLADAGRHSPDAGSNGQAPSRKPASTAQAAPKLMRTA